MDTTFPLTPALSLGEVENRRPRSENSRSASQYSRPDGCAPSPQGRRPGVRGTGRAASDNARPSRLWASSDHSPVEPGGSLGDDEPRRSQRPGEPSAPAEPAPAGPAATDSDPTRPQVGPPALSYIVLTGNPNSGKTTLFNALTGLRAKVGNYAGVTVERKEGRLLNAPGTSFLPVIRRGRVCLCADRSRSRWIFRRRWRRPVRRPHTR